MVLTVLHPPAKSRKTGQANKERQIDADIIAVHGLNGNEITTWTSKSEAFWLKDFLPKDIPNARVMTFGYPSEAVFGDTTATVRDHAKRLLSRLSAKRGKDEEGRPIVFIGHSLGGIIVKQALFQASNQNLYQDICDSTIGIIFLGTPHRGSDKANYANVLVSIANSVLNKPPPSLVQALKTNSETLMSLNNDFRSQIAKYRIYSFYEERPMKPLSSLIVDRHSALLDIDGEEQIPIDANHEEMCKFLDREDENYEQVYIRVQRLIAEVKGGVGAPTHFCVPYTSSGIFTGREDVLQKLHDGFFGVHSGDTQKRFVLHGIGGSGKTQTCLKFVEMNRARFWGVFWIDASSEATTKNLFLDVAREQAIESNTDEILRFLAHNEKNWLLIIDNADDPSLNVARFFPVNQLGSVIITSRNPYSASHATVGSCELGGLDPKEGEALLLRAASIKGDPSLELLACSAGLVKQLGYLALAITQAGACIQQGMYSISEYTSLFESHEKNRASLMRTRPHQFESNYHFSVYTALDVSLQAIRNMRTETSSHATELLGVFGFLHNDGISENIFKRAWENRDENDEPAISICRSFYMKSAKWDLIQFRKATIQLAEFSIIRIEEPNRISIHPLVHDWIRDSPMGNLRSTYWVTASSTLAVAASIQWDISETPWKIKRRATKVRAQLIPHIEKCIESFEGSSIVVPGKELYNRQDLKHTDSRDESGSCTSVRLRVQVLEKFVYVLAEHDRWAIVWKIWEAILKAQEQKKQAIFPDLICVLERLAINFGALIRHEDAVYVMDCALLFTKRTFGTTHPDTLRVMHALANSLEGWGEMLSRAASLMTKVIAERKKTLGREHTDTLRAMRDLAFIYARLGERQKAPRAVGLMEKVVALRQQTLGKDHPDSLSAMYDLALIYQKVRKPLAEVADLMEAVLDARRRVSGRKHPDTLVVKKRLAWIRRLIGNGLT